MRVPSGSNSYLDYLDSHAWAADHAFFDIRGAIYNFFHSGERKRAEKEQREEAIYMGQWVKTLSAAEPTVCSVPYCMLHHD